MIEGYAPFIGEAGITELQLLGRRLHGQRIRCINATKLGGGVAEILQRMVPMCDELGVDMRWDIIEGHEAFYRMTKKMHNALHGKSESFTPEQFDLFLEVNQSNLEQLQLDDDIVFIHDPQPIAFVRDRTQRGNRWLWRCHIDVSMPQTDVWNFLRPFILQYDAAIYSAPAFVQQLSMRQWLIAPSIDPLSDKNKELEPETIAEVLRRLEIPTDRPIVTQVSRFDYLKDPVGVIQAFKRARKSVKCRLVLVGGPASDDPEGAEVLARVQEEAHGNPEIHVLLLPPTSNTEINALQRVSAVVLQKSLKEGFGLTVSEALWKRKPVVASAVGGIPLQVKHGYSGLLVHSIDGCAAAIRQLLGDPAYAKKLGENGREHVRQNFLITRHLQDYLAAFLMLGRVEDYLMLNGAE